MVDTTSRSFGDVQTSIKLDWIGKRTTPSGTITVDGVRLEDAPWLLFDDPDDLARELDGEVVTSPVFDSDYGIQFTVNGEKYEARVYVTDDNRSDVTIFPWGEDHFENVPKDDLETTVEELERRLYE